MLWRLTHLNITIYYRNVNISVVFFCSQNQNWSNCNFLVTSQNWSLVPRLAAYQYQKKKIWFGHTPSTGYILEVVVWINKISAQFFRKRIFIGFFENQLYLYNSVNNKHAQNLVWIRKLMYPLPLSDGKAPELDIHTCFQLNPSKISCQLDKLYSFLTEPLSFVFTYLFCTSMGAYTRKESLFESWLKWKLSRRSVRWFCGFT